MEKINKLKKLFNYYNLDGYIVPKNDESIKEVNDDYDFNQDKLFDQNEEYRSPGWERLKKKLIKQ